MKTAEEVAELTRKKHHQAVNDVHNKLKDMIVDSASAGKSQETYMVSIPGSSDTFEVTAQIVETVLRDSGFQVTVIPMPPRHEQIAQFKISWGHYL